MTRVSAAAPRLRPVAHDDAAGLWAILKPTFRAGDTYAVDADISREEALAYWCAPEHTVWVAETDGMVGTYSLRPIHGGGGRHVCNAAFVTHPEARRQGVARAMLSHALQAATARGFRAMQFNFVVETNAAAIALWRAAGFDQVGRLPEAFHHPARGFVDALVMFRRL